MVNSLVAVTCRTWQGVLTKPGTMAILGISHSGIELIGTTNSIFIEAVQFLESIFKKFQTTWSLKHGWTLHFKNAASYQRWQTSDWNNQLPPPKKVWSKTAPEKMLKSKKSGWTTCYVLYVKIICIFELYYIHIYQEYIGSYFSSYQRVDPRLTKVADVFSCNTPVVGKCTRNGWMNVFTERMKWKAGNCSTAAYQKSPPTTPLETSQKLKKNTHTQKKNTKPDWWFKIGK